MGREGIKGAVVRSWVIIGCLLASFSLVGPALAKCQLGLIAEMPVTMTARGPIVPAKFDGVDVFLTVNDSDTFSIVSSAEAAALHLSPSSLPSGINVLSGGRKINAQFIRIKDLNLGGRDINNVDIIVGGDDDWASNRTGGILGQNILRIADLEYDLPDGLLRLVKPQDCARSPLAYWAAAAQPYSAIPMAPTAIPVGVPMAGPSGAPSGDILINGVRLRAQFRATQRLTLLSLQAANEVGVKVEQSKSSDQKFRVGSVKSIQIGDEKVLNTHLFIQDFKGDADVLIGADFFLSHHIYMAYSQSRIYFTYSGGPVFDLRSLQTAGAETPLAAATPSVDQPTDAEAFSRRAAGSSVRGEYKAALDDLDRACALSPKEARYRRERAEVRWALDDLDLSLTDFDTAVELAPSDVLARVERASLRMIRKDMHGAQIDLDAASAAASAQSDLRLRISSLYAAIDAFEPAVEQADLWLKAHPDDSRYGRGLNARGWAEALEGRDLDKALADCNGAIRTSPRNADFLDTCGLIHLRRREFIRAISDYNAALTLNPKIFWSRYGRGIAELKTGAKAQGQADLAAAVALQPNLAERAAKLGLMP